MGFAALLGSASTAPLMFGWKEEHPQQSEQPPKPCEHQHRGKNDQCGDQNDASQAEHGAEQLLDAADQVGDGLADQHHQIHLFGQSLQQLSLIHI